MPPLERRTRLYRLRRPRDLNLRLLNLMIISFLFFFVRHLVDKACDHTDNGGDETKHINPPICIKFTHNYKMYVVHLLIQTNSQSVHDLCQGKNEPFQLYQRHQR